LEFSLLGMNQFSLVERNRSSNRLESQCLMWHYWKSNRSPVFFDENLNSDRYSALIVTDLSVLLKNLLQLRLNMWFQQDACLSYTSRFARAALNAMFPNKWIGKYGPINYLPRSPDRTVLDYYFWGRIKDLIYHERPTTRDNMIRRISEAIRSLRAEEVLRAINYFQNRVDVCIAERMVLILNS